MCRAGGGQPFTMDSLLASQFGSILSGGSVIAVGFNLGTGQRQCHIGIDWLETNLLNAGAQIDFGPGTPVSTTFPVVTMGAATIGGGNDPVFAPPTGWSLGPSTPVNPETEFGAQVGVCARVPQTGACHKLLLACVRLYCQDTLSVAQGGSHHFVSRVGGPCLQGSHSKQTCAVLHCGGV